MKKDFLSYTHAFVAGWIRFWFPWVRYFEQDSVGDESWQLNMKDTDLMSKDIVWEAFHETIPALRAALKEIADTKCGDDCLDGTINDDINCVHEIAHEALAHEV